MRMWMLPPSRMCRKHLLGEHVEIHMLVGSLQRGRSIQGHLERGQLEPQHVEERHNVLVEEMERRGYKHKSPLPHVEHDRVGHVDLAVSIHDLTERCPECAKRLQPSNTNLLLQKTRAILSKNLCVLLVRKA